MPAPASLITFGHDRFGTAVARAETRRMTLLLRMARSQGLLPERA